MYKDEENSQEIKTHQKGGIYMNALRTKNARIREIDAYIPTIIDPYIAELEMRRVSEMNLQELSVFLNTDSKHVTPLDRRNLVCKFARKNRELLKTKHKLG